MLYIFLLSDSEVELRLCGLLPLQQWKQKSYQVSTTWWIIYHHNTELSHPAQFEVSDSLNEEVVGKR